MMVDAVFGDAVTHGIGQMSLLQQEAVSKDMAGKGPERGRG